MSAFLWLALCCIGYAAIAFWSAQTVRAYRLKRKPLLSALLFVPLVTLGIVLLIPPIGRLLAAWILLAGLSAFLTKIYLPREPLLPEREIKLSILHLVLISASLLFLIPFVWMLVTSVKTDAQMAAYPPIWIPHPVLWGNYLRSLQFLPKSSDYGLINLANTLIYAVMAVIGMVLSSSMVAYGFARMRWPGRDWLFGVLLATMMLPDAVTMMPRFLIFRDLHWINTLLPLWVPAFFSSAFNVFLLRQFFMGIPQELEDAAKIDGCGPFGTWWRVMLPMVKPALAAVSIMTFLGAWKDFMGPLIYISSPQKMPLSYLLELYNSSHGGEPGLLMAATTLVALPIIILFFFTQRYFIEGVTLTGLGGR